MKRVGNKTYLHKSAFHELPAHLQQYILVAEDAAEQPRWNIARVDHVGVVMLGYAPKFGDVAHPALAESWTVTRHGSVTHRRYSGETAPVYHRTELMLSEDDPRRAKLARVSAREEAAGLLGRSDIGTVGAWRRVKRMKRNPAGSVPSSQKLLGIVIDQGGKLARFTTRNYRGVQRMYRRMLAERKTSDHLIVLSMGLGRDSITMLCLLAEGNLVAGGRQLGPHDVDAVVFSDPGFEWQHSYDLIPRVKELCDRIGVRWINLEKPPKDGPLGWLAWVDKTKPVDEGKPGYVDPRHNTPPWVLAGRKLPTLEARAAAGTYHSRAPIMYDYMRTRSITLRKSAACTDTHKIQPINVRFIGDLLVEQYGLGATAKKPFSRAKALWKKLVEKDLRQPNWVLIGIAADELERAESGKKARARATEGDAAVMPQHPLVEMGIAKADEQAILSRHGFGDVRKSGCMVCHFQTDGWWWALSQVRPDIFELAAKMEHEANVKRVEHDQSLRFLRGYLPLPENTDEWRRRHPTAKIAAILDKDYSMQRSGMCPVMQGAMALQQMVSALKLTAAQKTMLKAAVAGEDVDRNKTFAHLVTKGVFDSEGNVLEIGHNAVDMWHKKVVEKDRKAKVKADILARYGLKKNPRPSGPAFPYGDPLDALCCCHDPHHRASALKQNPRRNPADSSCKTAIKRGGPSMPVKWLHKEDQLQGEILDFGSGRGEDVAWLRRKGRAVVAYDPCHGPEKLPTRKFDTILVTYVLNTVSAREQSQIMSQVKRLLKPDGAAFFTVRSDVTTGKTGAGTYQRDVRLRLPLVASPGSARIYLLER